MSEQRKATAVAKPGAQTPAPPGPLDEEVMRRQAIEITNRDFYKVGWDPVERKDIKFPNARVWQKWANERQISTKVVRSVSDEKGCAVTVRGWIGDEAKPQVVHEETVALVWVHELEKLLVDAVRNGITIEQYAGGQGKKGHIMPAFDLTEVDASGVSRIVLRNPAHQLHVLAQWVRTKSFGDRVCLTKAASRCYRRLLGVEWREKEEIEHEAKEAGAVAEDNGGRGGVDAPTEDSPRAGTLGRAEPKTGGPRKTVSPMAITSLMTRFRDLGETFPLPEGEDHRTYLTQAAIGLMVARGVQITEAKLALITPADSGRLWALIGQVAHGNAEALATLDRLHAQGVKIIAGIGTRGGAA